MKRTLTFCFLTFFAVQLSAQSGMNNLGFEDWTTIAGQPSPNGFPSYGASQNTSANVPQGNSALTITTTEFTFQGGSVDTIGRSLLGEVSNQSLIQGEDISYCPDSITGFFKWDLPNQDTGVFVAQFYENGSFVGGTGTQVFDGTQSSWIPFSFEIAPANCGGNTPDTIQIIMASEGVGLFQNTDYGTQSLGGTASFDSLQLWNDGEPVGIESLTQSDVDYGVHPNPASQTARFEFGQEAERIRVFDMTGRNVRTLNVGQKRSEKRMQVGDLKSGLYLYRIENEEGQELHSDKLQVNN